MKNNKMKPMNSLPALTYRWVKLNDLQLDLEFPDLVSPYRKEYIVRNKEFMNNTNEFVQKITQDYRFISNSLYGRDFLEENLKSIHSDYPELISNSIDTSSGSYSISQVSHGRSVIDYGVSKELVKICETSYNAGIYINVPKGMNVKEPIRIEYSLDKENQTVYDYNIIYAAPESRVTVVMDYSTADETKTLHNGFTKIHAKEGSHVTLVKIQRMNDESNHLDSNIANICAGATVDYIQVELGSRYSITNYRNDISESGISTINSIYLGDKERLTDLSYLMNHVGRRSNSKILTKGALKDRAVKTFRGTIDFKQGAGKSEGSEEEFVLLFDQGVKSNAIPLLLCAEDDVKGQHAASAGKVDSNKLFYMMSRGFSKEEAMKLIVEASFQPTIDQIPFDDLRQIIGAEIHRRLMNETI